MSEGNSLTISRLQRQSGGTWVAFDDIGKIIIIQGRFAIGISYEKIGAGIDIGTDRCWIYTLLMMSRWELGEDRCASGGFALVDCVEGR